MKKETYYAPTTEVIKFSASDIIRTSVDVDDNQGIWDKQ